MEGLIDSPSGHQSPNGTSHELSKYVYIAVGGGRPRSIGVNMQITTNATLPLPERMRYSITGGAPCKMR